MTWHHIPEDFNLHYVYAVQVTSYVIVICAESFIRVASCHPGSSENMVNFIHF